MKRGAALCLGIAVATSLAQERAKDADSFEIEPPLLIPNRGDQPLLETKSEADKSSPDIDIEKLEKQFARAKSNAAGVERLCRIGALSKVEVEQRALRVVRLEFDLASARLARVKEAMLEAQNQFAAGKIEKPDLAETETALAFAIKAAHAAAARRDRAEIDAAEANVRRQEKLLALGSARKSDLERAEQKLAEMKATKN